jgi:hypothetical protein
VGRFRGKTEKRVKNPRPEGCGIGPCPLPFPHLSWEERVDNKVDNLTTAAGVPLGLQVRLDEPESLDDAARNLREQVGGV